MNVCQSLLLGWRLFPGRTALLFQEKSYSYEELEQLSGRAAAVLRELGVRSLDRVALILPNVPAFLVWYYASLRLGAIAVSVNTRLSGEEMAFIVDDCGARIVIGTEELLPAPAEVMPDCVERTLAVSADGTRFQDEALETRDSIGRGVFEDMNPDQPAVILYTSGTTGFPKGATLTHRNIRATVEAFNHLCGTRPEDRLLLAVPLFHCFGQNALLNAGFNVGCTLVLQPGFDLEKSKRLIATHRVTQLFTVPTVFRLLHDSCTPEDLASVTYFFSAAAPLPLWLGNAWAEKFGRPIHEGYGLTETAPFASYNHHLRFVPGSIGTPVDMVEMKIVDPETGRECPPGVPGEIAIRGPNVMQGYWNRPEATAQAVRDGWFYSGDIGRTDELGYFYIVDRLKDMISVGALKVFPAEVERVLGEHPAVSEVAVVGLANGLLGEQVVAFVVARAGSSSTEGELREYCRPHLAAYKVPARISVVESLPRNPSGKVLKTRLRESGLAETPPPLLLDHQSGEQLRRTLQDHVREQVARVLAKPVDQLDGGRGFMELGMDSVKSLELHAGLERSLGCALPATLSFDYPTLDTLLDFLAQRLEKVGPVARPEEANLPETALGELAELEDLSDEDIQHLLRAQGQTA